MAKTVFDKILDTTTGPKSYNWYSNEVKKMTTTSARALINQSKTTLRRKFGVMNLFAYYSKHKAKLPYYDKFPLTIIVGPAAGGFTGLNLHYLPMVLRAKLLDALMDITSDKKYDDNTKFNLSYNTLKRASSMKYFKPCFKRYLTANVKSRFARVPASEWEIATFLPTASFEKASKTTVWKDSRGMI